MGTLVPDQVTEVSRVRSAEGAETGVSGTKQRVQNKADPRGVSGPHKRIDAPPALRSLSDYKKRLTSERGLYGPEIVSNTGPTESV